MPRLILASGSPQRKTLLQGIGLSFEVIPSTVSEVSCLIQGPEERASCLARMKALNVSERYLDAFVIGCDTLVVAEDGTLLEKPEDEDAAREMILLQSGRTSTVHSALCIAEPGGLLHEGISSSSVTFKHLSDSEVGWWIGTGLWKDRSGAFQIDGLGQLMIEKLEGDFTSVVGLPVFLLGRLLEEAGYDLFQS